MEIRFRVPVNFGRRVKARAALEGISINDFVRDAVTAKMGDKLPKKEESLVERIREWFSELDAKRLRKRDVLRRYSISDMALKAVLKEIPAYEFVDEEESRTRWIIQGYQ